MCCLAKRRARFYRCASTIYDSIRSAGFGPNRRRSTAFVEPPGCPSHAAVVLVVRSISAAVAVKRSCSPEMQPIRILLVVSHHTATTSSLLLNVFSSNLHLKALVQTLGAILSLSTFVPTLRRGRFIVTAFICPRQRRRRLICPGQPNRCEKQTTKPKMFTPTVSLVGRD